MIINADAKATHQSVIDVMQAAQQAGLSHISFATQQAQSLSAIWRRRGLPAWLLLPVGIVFFLVVALRRPAVSWRPPGSRATAGAGHCRRQHHRRRHRQDAADPLAGRSVARGAAATPGSSVAATAAMSMVWAKSGRDGVAELVGDEPLLIRRRAGCPVFVGRDRVAAGRALLAAPSGLRRDPLRRRLAALPPCARRRDRRARPARPLERLASAGRPAARAGVAPAVGRCAGGQRTGRGPARLSHDPGGRALPAS